MTIVSDRSEARTIYEQISKCPFVWLYKLWVSLGYEDCMIRSIMEGLGSKAYNMAICVSSFDPETIAIEVEVELNE